MFSETEILKFGLLKSVLKFLAFYGRKKDTYLKIFVLYWERFLFMATLLSCMDAARLSKSYLMRLATESKGATMIFNCGNCFSFVVAIVF